MLMSAYNLIYLIKYRPYLSKQNNFVEIFNEAYIYLICQL
jgi:hypothetical protein